MHMCMYRMYLVCILYVFMLTYFNPYVHVLYVLYVCACMLYVWYVLAEASTECICVCIVCIMCISNLYLYVLYVFAPTSTDASTTSPKDPPLGRHPAGPTQGTPGQVADHFFRPSETHPRTRFGAPARAARVGGSKVHPLLSQ
jgi:hypothetical protein